MAESKSSWTWATRIFVYQDAPGHVVALGRWRSRADADAVREKYQHSPTIAALLPLLLRPRERWILLDDEPPAG